MNRERCPGRRIAVMIAVVAGSVALTPAAAVARIPVSGQISLADEADVFMTTSARYGLPNVGYALAADPADASKLAIQVADNANGAYFFEEGDEPASLILEWEEYHAQAGGSGCVFFELTDVDGQLLSFRRNAGDTRLAAVPNSGDVIWSQNLPLGQWVRLRLEYDARSGGPGSDDGAIVVKMDAGSGLTTVATVADHDLARIRAVRLRLLKGSTTSRLAAWRKLVWDGTGQDIYGAAAGTASLWRDKGHQLGVMEPDGAGTVALKVWAHYNVGLYGAADTACTAEVQIAGDESFSAPVSQSVPLPPADAYNGVASFSGLSPNTVYYVRAVLIRDGAPAATTYATAFRTISVPGGAPGALHIIHGSCSNSGSAWTPHTAFRTALANSPAGATLVFSDCGDLNYHDVLLGYENLPPGPANPNATDALFDRMYDQPLLADGFNALASRASCWFMWDDHEVHNGWNGPGMGGIDDADPALFETAQSAAYRWWGNRLASGTSLTRRYFHVESARCLFVYLDARTDSDHLTTLLGAAQKAWVEQLLQTTSKPLVFLISPVTWSSGSIPSRRRENWHNYTDERDEIIQTFLDAGPCGHLFLLSGDHHFCMHNSSDFQVFGPRVHGDFMCGAYASPRQAVSASWMPGGPFAADDIETFDVAPGDLIRAYMTIDVDEAALTVRVAFTDGVSGEERYVQAYDTAPPQGDLDCSGGVHTSDLLVLFSGWGPCGTCGGCAGDLDGDCVVDGGDVAILFDHWD